MDVNKEFNKDFTATDSEGNLIYKDDVVSYLNSEYERRRQEKNSLQLQWELTANFISGNQYCDINTNTSTIEQINKEKDWTQKEVFNHMAAIYETRLAKLSGLKLSMSVRPRGNELDDISKAEISSSILKGVQINTGFSDIFATAMSWCEICGTVFFMSWWDTNKGNLIYDDEGVKSFTGDLSYGLITAFEVFPDSIFNQEISDCGSIMIRQVKSVDEIYNLYGIEVEGRSLPTFALSSVPTGGMGYEAAVMSVSDTVRDNCENVTTYFEKPGRKFPNGRMIVMVGDNTIVHYSDLPCSCGERFIPLVKCCSIKRPGQFFGGSVQERLIPVQRAYNALKNRKHDYLNRVAYGAYTADPNSVDIDGITEKGIAPGEIIPKKPGGEGLDPIQIAPLPASFENEETRLQREFEYLSGISEMAVISSAPSGVKSGVALNALTASDNARLSLVAENMRNAVIETAKQWLKILKQCAVLPRVLQYAGTNNMANVITWSREDITSNDVIFDTENELNDTLENRRQNIVSLINSGFLADENGVVSSRIKRKLLEAMRLGNWEDATDIDNLHISKAKRENISLESGIIPVVADFDNHELHIDEHNRFRLQSKYMVFEQKYPAMAEAFAEHIKKHESIIMQRQMQMMASV